MNSIILGRGIILLSYLCGTCLCVSNIDAMIDCMTEYPSKQGVLEFIINGELQDESEQNAKCLFYCIPLKMGYIEENEYPTSAIVKKYFKEQHPDFANDNDLDTAIDSCVAADVANVSDNCDRLYRLSKCQMKFYLQKSGKQ